MNEPGSVLARFLSHVNRTGDCWVWVGSLTKKGYGRMRLNGRIINAHRRAYQLFNGPIPRGLMVLHSCDNPPCVNPAHLHLGTNQDNVNEKMERGRFRPMHGADNPQSKITTIQAMEIRKSRELVRVLASRYGLSLSQVSAIRTGRNWRQLGGAQ